MPHTLRKINAIVATVTTRAKKSSRKYGIEVPDSADHSHDIDMNNINGFWGELIDKEMCVVGSVIEIVDEKDNIPCRWSKSSLHLMFDVIIDFTHTYRWVFDSFLIVIRCNLQLGLYMQVQ